MFTAPFRWEEDHYQGINGPENLYVVLDSNDDVVATCATDLHAAEVCERLNRSELVTISTGTSSYTVTRDGVNFSYLVAPDTPH